MTPLPLERAEAGRLRSLVVLVVLASLGTLPVAPALPAGPDQPAAVVAVGEAAGATLVSWSLVPGATHYTLYRGESLETMVAIYRGSHPMFVDEERGDASVFYGVTSGTDTVESDMTAVYSGGHCVSWNGNAKFSVSLSGCVS